MALILSEMMEYDTSEIATMTGVAEHKVRRRLRRGKERLRKMFTQEKVIHNAAGA
jgi:DNA-directed RNA polymerase specialized sigma24 family protein